MIYVTVGSRDEALRIGRTLVKEKLAACINIIDNMRSLYEWEGKMEETQECILLAKTGSQLFERLKERLLQLHSYDCPCILELPVERGEAAFMDWIQKQTTPIT